MARKKGEEEPCGNWMDTYGDMVTLLLTFFVMLFSMSSVNEQKYAILVQAFTSKTPDSMNIILDQSGGKDGEFPLNRGDHAATGEELANASLEELEQMVPDSFDDLYEYLKAYVEKSNMQGAVEVAQAGDGCVMIRFQDNIFFNPDSAYLKRESQPLLEFLGNCLYGVEDQILTVNINGHTADPGIENYSVSDWTLSSERASKVAIYFEEQKGIDPKKLLPIGYGKNYPIAPNDTPEGRERNRRVDMIIISTNSSLSTEDILASILDGTMELEPQLTEEQGGVSDVLIPKGEEDEVSQPPPVIPSPPSSSQEEPAESSAPSDGEPEIQIENPYGA